MFDKDILTENFNFNRTVGLNWIENLSTRAIQLHTENSLPEIKPNDYSF